MEEIRDFFESEDSESDVQMASENNMEENLKETLVMVADYTEADKAKLLKKVYLCGQGMLIVSAASFIMYFVQYFIGGIVLTPLLLIIAGGILAINTTLAGLQLKGRISKEKNTKLLRITITIWVALALMLLLFLTFVLPTILVNVFGMGTPVA